MLKESFGKGVEELQTSLCEIEAVINSRPLAYACEDDLNEVLTLSTCCMVGTFVNH